jgi:hypothetical protein
MARLPALVRRAAPRPRVTLVSPEPVEPACAARPRRTGQRNRPATERRRHPDRRFSAVQETREPRRSLDDVALLYELGNLVPVHWASWQVEVVRHPAMTGDVLRQAEPLGVSGDQLLVFSRCRSDAEADAPVAVLVDDEPREVLLPTRKPRCGGCRSSAVASGRAKQMFVARSSNSASTATSLTKRRLAARPIPPGGRRTA